MYRLGLPIAELQQRFEDDSTLLPDDELFRLYGKHGRYLSRPTSNHLGSPLLVDQYGIEYTPVDSGTSVSWYARISPSQARRARDLMATGLSLEPNRIGGDIYPPPGTQLELRRAVKHPYRAEQPPGVDPEATIRATVLDFDADGRKASTLITFEEAISTQKTAHEIELYSRRAQAYGIILSQS